MTSIIKADNISTVSGSGNITVPTGVKVVGTDTASIVAPGMVVGSQRTEMTGDVYSDSNTLFSVGVTVNYTPKFVGSLLQVRHVAWVRSAGSGAECRLRWEVKRTVGGVDTVVAEDRHIGPYDYGSNGIWMLNAYEVFEEHTTSTTDQHSWTWRMRAAGSGQGNGGVYFNENAHGDRISFVHIQEIAQ